MLKARTTMVAFSEMLPAPQTESTSNSYRFDVWIKWENAKLSMQKRWAPLEQDQKLKQPALQLLNQFLRENSRAGQQPV